MKHYVIGLMLASLMSPAQAQDLLSDWYSSEYQSSASIDVLNQLGRNPAETDFLEGASFPEDNSAAIEALANRAKQTIRQFEDYRDDELMYAEYRKSAYKGITAAGGLVTGPVVGAIIGLLGSAAEDLADKTANRRIQERRLDMRQKVWEDTVLLLDLRREDVYSMGPEGLREYASEKLRQMIEAPIDPSMVNSDDPILRARYLMEKDVLAAESAVVLAAQMDQELQRIIDKHDGQIEGIANEIDNVKFEIGNLYENDFKLAERISLHTREIHTLNRFRRQQIQFNQKISESFTELSKIVSETLVEIDVINKKVTSNTKRIEFLEAQGEFTLDLALENRVLIQHNSRNIGMVKMVLFDQLDAEYQMNLLQAGFLEGVVNPEVMVEIEARTQSLIDIQKQEERMRRAIAKRQEMARDIQQYTALANETFKLVAKTGVFGGAEAKVGKAMAIGTAVSSFVSLALQSGTGVGTITGGVALINSVTDILGSGGPDIATLRHQEIMAELQDIKSSLEYLKQGMEQVNLKLDSVLEGVDILIDLNTQVLQNQQILARQIMTMSEKVDFYNNQLQQQLVSILSYIDQNEFAGFDNCEEVNRTLALNFESSRFDDRFTIRSYGLYLEDLIASGNEDDLEAEKDHIEAYKSLIARAPFSVFTDYNDFYATLESMETSLSTCLSSLSNQVRISSSGAGSGSGSGSGRTHFFPPFLKTIYYGSREQNINQRFNILVNLLAQKDEDLAFKLLAPSFSLDGIEAKFYANSRFRLNSDIKNQLFIQGMRELGNPYRVKLAAETFLKMEPYFGFTDPTGDSYLLMDESSLITRDHAPEVAKTKIESTLLPMVDVAIAQTALLGGDTLLPYLDQQLFSETSSDQRTIDLVIDLFQNLRGQELYFEIPDYNQPVQEDSEDNTDDEARQQEIVDQHLAFQEMTSPNSLGMSSPFLSNLAHMFIRRTLGEQDISFEEYQFLLDQSYHIPGISVEPTPIEAMLSKTFFYGQGIHQKKLHVRPVLSESHKVWYLKMTFIKGTETLAEVVAPLPSYERLQSGQVRTMNILSELIGLREKLRFSLARERLVLDSVDLPERDLVKLMQFGGGALTR